MFSILSEQPFEDEINKQKEQKESYYGLFEELGSVG
jgi:hypothetical protein